MDPLSTHNREDNLRGRCRYSNSATAERQDSYRIKVPDEAWAALPQATYVVTLVSLRDAGDGQSAVELTSLGGDTLDISLDKDATVGQLMQRVKEERHLGPHIVIIVSSDGTILRKDLPINAEETDATDVGYEDNQITPRNRSS